jgi:UPF0755 protein
MTTIRTRTAAGREPSRSAVASPRRVERDSRPWRHDPWDDPDDVPAIITEHPRHSRWPFKVIVYTLGVLLVAGILVGGGIGWWYIHEINPEGDPAPAVNFTVNADETVETLSERLETEGLIENARVFRWYVERHGGLELTPGYYRLRPRDHMGNIMAVLRTPPAETYTSVTFPEGYTLTRMANRLAEKSPRYLVSDFIKAATSGAIRSDFLAQPPEINTLEGLLFPDTYQVSNGESVDQVIGRMVTRMERVGRQENIVEKGYVQGLTAYQVLIVASLVEREAKTAEDRPLIARVILNLLRMKDEAGNPAPMTLQIDAALYYEQDPNMPFDVLKSIDSPYNTYLHVGLPPTPIANPGRASIKAVLNPATNPPEGGALCQGVPQRNCQYLYYVLADEEGNHAFAVTLEQHEANIEKARAAGVIP